MFTLPVWESGWAEVFAGVLFAAIMGKVQKQETRLLQMCLIAALLTGSYVSLFVVPIIAMIPMIFEYIRQLGD